MRTPSPGLLLQCIGVAALAFTAAQAGAQISGSVSVVSDYRVRGVSLSNGRPEPQLSLGYDGRGGWYAGAFASGVDFKDEKTSHAQLLAYAGYASRHSSSGMAWDTGIAGSVFPGASGYDYIEASAGFATDKMNGRLHFSPDYFGGGAGTLYMEINSARPIRQRLRLLGHAGYLHVLGNAARSGEYARDSADVSLGLGIVMPAWSVRMAWVHRRMNGEISEPEGRTRSPAWVLTVIAPF